MKTMCHPMESQPSTYRRRPCGSPAKYRPSRRWASCSSFQAVQDAACLSLPHLPTRALTLWVGRTAKLRATWLQDGVPGSGNPFLKPRL